jgi:hypothetical protein
MIMMMGWGVDGKLTTNCNLRDTTTTAAADDRKVCEEREKLLINYV